VSDRACVVVTRPAAESDALAARLRSRGHRVLVLPCVRTEPLAERASLRGALASLTTVDWLVVTSPAGADAVADVGLRVVAPIAAVGRATAERLRERGSPVAFVPSRADGATLARELPAPSGLVLLARSDRAVPELPAGLAERGIAVREVLAYRTVAEASGAVAPVRRALESDHAVVVFSSPSAVEGFLAAVDERLAARAAFVATGATTARRLRDLLGVVPRIASTDENDLSEVLHDLGA
jgi:uroporphyrinogen-III synthase